MTDPGACRSHESLVRHPVRASEHEVENLWSIAEAGDSAATPAINRGVRLVVVVLHEAIVTLLAPASPPLLVTPARLAAGRPASVTGAAFETPSSQLLPSSHRIHARATHPRKEVFR